VPEEVYIIAVPGVRVPTEKVNIVSLRLVPISYSAMSYYIGRELVPAFTGSPIPLDVETLYVYDSVSIGVCGVEFDRVDVIAPGVLSGSMDLGEVNPKTICRVVSVPVNVSVSKCSLSGMERVGCTTYSGCVDLTPGLYYVECTGPCFVGRDVYTAYGEIEVGFKGYLYASRVCSSSDFKLCRVEGDLSQCKNSVKLYIVFYRRGEMVAYAYASVTIYTLGV